MRLTSFVRKLSGPAEVAKIRASHIHPSVGKATHFARPLLVRNAKMQWIFDHEGKKYLDLFGGIVTVGVGHSHPKVVDALKKQADLLWHTTNIYLNEPLHSYAQKLAAKFPDPLKVVYLVNSGSEANDLALLMARVASGNWDVVALRNGYHGMSPSTMGLTGHSTWKQNSPAIFAGIHHAMNPDPYRGIWGGNKCRDSSVQVDRSCSCQGTCQAEDQYVKQLDELIVHTIPQKKVAGMFIESIQGVGGVVQYPRGYVKKAFDLVKSYGGLTISDEVQTGFGRTGDKMWDFESHGVIPDIVTLAKSIGNGFPLAAVITSEKIANCMTAASHFNTFGGNPMGCAVGEAVLDVIEEEGLQNRCKILGQMFLSGLDSLRSEFSIIGDVRGKGLMLGLELVKDKETKEPLESPKVNAIFEDLKNDGLLLGKGGYSGNVLRMTPPMCLNNEDVELAISTMRKVFDRHSTKN